MNENPIMIANDAVYGSTAECFITIEGQRFNFMSMTEFESNWDVKITEVPILGKVGMGHKAAGGKGTWKGKAHYNQSHFRRMADTYQKTGRMPYFKSVMKILPVQLEGKRSFIEDAYVKNLH